MAQREGTVEFFYATKGYGSVAGNFFHWSDIQMEGFRAMLPGWRAEFEPGMHNGSAHAFHVRPLELKGLTTREGAVQVDIQGGMVDLSVDTLGRVYALNKRPVAPHIEGNGTFRAFSVGGETIERYGLYLPEPTKEYAFVLLDQNKLPRKKFHGYELAPAGSYILRVAADGDVLVSVFGRRFQAKPQGRGDSWVVIEHRLKNQYDLKDLSLEAMLRQTPAGRTRNEEFIPGILRACAWMKRAI